MLPVPRARADGAAGAGVGGQYAGQQFDTLTGLYSLRARYYNPSEGRFLSRDLAAVDVHNPVELNRYGYARANPINYGDPSGYSATTLMPGKTWALPAPTQPASKPQAGGGAMAEYASLLNLIGAIGIKAGTTDIGRATHCMYLRATSVVMAANKAGPPLALLSLSRPLGEKCVIPVFIYFGDSVAYHIEVAQFQRGKEMLKVLDRNDGGVVTKRRRVATAPCRRRPNTDYANNPSAWGPAPSQCDEYPYASTANGGDGASVMIVPASHNGFHGEMLRSFYNNTGVSYSNRWKVKLNDGTWFATVVFGGLPPSDPTQIRP